MTKDKSEKSETSQYGETVECRYIRSSVCRSIHVDGGIVEFGPKNQITLSLFAEHFAPPVREIFSVKGNRAEVLETEEDTGFVREIEAICYLDLETANWLNARLGEVLAGLKEEN